MIAADFYGASRLLPLSGEWHGAHLEPLACSCALEQHLGGTCWLAVPRLCPHPRAACLLSPGADEDILRKVQANIAECEPAFREAKVRPCNVLQLWWAGASTQRAQPMNASGCKPWAASLVACNTCVSPAPPAN